MKTKREIRKVLVIRFRRVGDAVLSSAVCSTLKKSFPDAEIHYVLNDNIASLFEHHPHIDKVIPFTNVENKSFPAYLRKIRSITRAGKYDIIVDCRSTIRTLFFSLFSLRTPYRLGSKKKYNRFLNNYRTGSTHIDSSVDKTLALLKPLENEFSIQYDPHFCLKISSQEEAAYRQYLLNEGIDFNRPVVVCAVAARLAHKVWNTDYAAEILNKMIEKYNAQLIFNFAGPEKEVAQQVKEKMGNPASVFLNIEANSLSQLGALLKNSDFFFGNEGGPRHIAQALDIPAFAIYPPNIPKKEWLPNASEKFQGIEPADFVEPLLLEQMAYEEAFNTMTPEVVYDKLSPMLKKFLVKNVD